MRINEKLLNLREIFKMNKKEFAELLGVSQPTIARYEDGSRLPEYLFLKKLFTDLNVNPDWIFFGKEPKFLELDHKYMYASNNEMLKDINLIFTPAELNNLFSDVLFSMVNDKIIVECNEYSIELTKLFNAVKVVSNIPFRPFLFIYYIYRYIQFNKEELSNIDSYKDYLIELVNRYKIISFKNQPENTSIIKEEVKIFIELNITESECETLLINCESILEKIESKMTNRLLYTLKNIDIQTIFPVD